jgi:hypothetical protein
LDFRDKELELSPIPPFSFFVSSSTQSLKLCNATLEVPETVGRAVLGIALAAASDNDNFL